MANLDTGMIRQLVAAAALFVSKALVAAPGSLLIVGGALDPGNAAIHRALLDGRPADAPVIAIIPSASGYPADSARSFAATLIRHGASAADIIVVHLAAVDDPTTPAIDEQRWDGHAGNAAEIAKLERAGAIWFTGGDQLRTTSLLAPGGRETPMLAAIRARLAGGAIVGGSSAGAAIMSDPMITNGDSVPALARAAQRQTEPDNRDETGTLVLGDGLAFLPTGLVDQHFDARARLGRLARALFELPPAERVGFGIDENTALRIRLGPGTADVLGTGQVTVLDGRKAVRPASGATAFSANGLRLSLLSSGDQLALPDLSTTPAPGRAPIGRQPDAVAMADAGGFAHPAERTADLIADGLFRRAPDAVLARTSFHGRDAVRYRFRRTDQSSAASGTDANGRPGITVVDVLFDIESVPSTPTLVHP